MGAKPLEGAVVTREADQPGVLPASQALPGTSLKGRPLGSPVATETSRGTGPGGSLNAAHRWGGWPQRKCGD